VFTTLPLDLLATSLAGRAADSFATLRNRDTDQQGAYGLGDRVPGAGPLVRINGDYADFENQATGRVERVGLIATAATPPAPARPATPSTDPFADRVRATGANRYELDASLVRELTSNPTSIRGVRFAPHVEGGQVAGFQLTYAAKSSIAAALGLQRGDVVQAVNGLALSSPDALLEIYGRLRQQTSFSADVLRGGKRVTLSYTVR
jgi:general secretion pathway protein C